MVRGKDWVGKGLGKGTAEINYEDDRGKQNWERGLETVLGRQEHLWEEVETKDSGNSRNL